MLIVINKSKKMSNNLLKIDKKKLNTKYNQIKKKKKKKKKIKKKKKKK